MPFKRPKLAILVFFKYTSMGMSFHKKGVLDPKNKIDRSINFRPRRTVDRGNYYGPVA